MKVVKQKDNKKILILIIVLAFFVFGSVSAYALFSPSFQSQNLTQEEKDSSDAKKDYIENTDENGQPLTPSEQQSDDVSFTLKDDGSNIIVTTQLTGITEGSCTIEVGDYSSTAEILYQPQFSTCKGFSISKSEIDTSDIFTLRVISGDTNIVVTKYLNG